MIYCIVRLKISRNRLIKRSLKIREPDSLMLARLLRQLMRSRNRLTAMNSEFRFPNSIFNCFLDSPSEVFHFSAFVLHFKSKII